MDGSSSPSTSSAATKRAFWLCDPTSRRNLPKVRLFRDWLLGHFPEAAR